MQLQASRNYIPNVGFLNKFLILFHICQEYSGTNGQCNVAKDRSPCKRLALTTCMQFILQTEKKSRDSTETKYVELLT